MWGFAGMVRYQYEQPPVQDVACEAGSGHLMVLRGDRVSELPMHGGRKQLGKGLMRKIQRDLGLR